MAPQAPLSGVRVVEVAIGTSAVGSGLAVSLPGSLMRDLGAEALSYRCKDGEYVQLWFGAKGAFEAFLEHIGDPPSEAGYNAELMSDAMEQRGARWADRTGFAAAFTDDPVAVQRGRVVSYEWGEHGLTRQPCFPPAIGPVPRPPAMSGIARPGEHTDEFLSQVRTAGVVQ